jgi:hypothetical protein
MSEEPAGGRNTQEPTRSETLLEEQLALVKDALAACFAQALAITPGQDEFGHARSNAYGDAVKMLKASAKLGRVVAEIRGKRFDHTIHVRRVGDGVRTIDVSANTDYAEPPRDQHGFPLTPNGQRRKALWLAEQQAKGDPLLDSQGSNGNSEPPRHAAHASTGSP